MIQSVAENDIIRADRVRTGSVLSRIHTHVYRIVDGCKQSAKSVNNLYTSVCIEMRFGSFEFGQSSDSDMDILKPNLKSSGLKVEPGLNSCLRDGDTTFVAKDQRVTAPAYKLVKGNEICIMMHSNMQICQLHFL